MRRLHPQACAAFRNVILLGLVFVALHGVRHIAIARQTTPAATPGAQTCDVAPRPVAEMVALLGPPPDNEQVREPTPLPLGTPADAATTEAITAVVRELEACFNMGDLLRVYALFSDDQFRQMPKTEEIVAELTALGAATPMPAAAGQRQVLTRPWHVVELEDGRVMAAVQFGFEEADYPRSTKALFFVRQDGRWLIQEMADFVWVEGSSGPVAVEDIVGSPPET